MYAVLERRASPRAFDGNAVRSWLGTNPEPLAVHGLIAGVALSLLSFDLLVAPAVGLKGVVEQMWPNLLVCLLFAGLYGMLRDAKLAKLAEASAAAMWATAVTLGLIVVTQIAARTPSPLVDDSLGRADSCFGVSTGRIVRFVVSHPWLHELLNRTYGQEQRLMFVSLFLPIFCGRARYARRFILSVLLAGILTVSIFAFLPASGPWTMGGFKPAPIQAVMDTALHQLKSGQPMRFQFELSSIISFPSFHVVLAVLCAVALWRIRYVRWPSTILCVLICVSTVTTGWHYFVDVLGGLLVSVVAANSAALVTSRLEREAVPALSPLR